MLFVCHSYVCVFHPDVSCMYSYVIRMSPICTRMSFACHSYVPAYVFVCQPYVIRMYSYFTRMSLICTRMSPVSHSYVFICHLYVTRMYTYVIRMSVVCGFTILLMIQFCVRIQFPPMYNL